MAAERYIEELNDFKANVLESEKKVLLLFFNAQVNDSLKFGTLLEEVNNEQGNPYKIVKIDLAYQENFGCQVQSGKGPHSSCFRYRGSS